VRRKNAAAFVLERHHFISPVAGRGGKMHWPVEWEDPPRSEEAVEEVKSPALARAQEDFRRLTPEERLLFLDWIQRGAPDGD
jgi:hypothetical protein